MLERATVAGPLGTYGIEAAIAAVHGRAVSAGATDWPRILELYERLEEITGSPIVTLNRAVALAMVNGPAGLALLDEVADRLGATHRSDAVRAHLLEMVGDLDAAVVHYRMAARRATSVPERRYLQMRAARLSGSREAEPRRRRGWQE